MVWGPGRGAGRSSAGVGGATGTLFDGGAPGCGWDQTRLLHLSTLETWKLKSSAGWRTSVIIQQPLLWGYLDLRLPRTLLTQREYPQFLVPSPHFLGSSAR